MRYEIPLTAGSQTFDVSLGGNQYTFTIVYRDAEFGGWFVDMVRTDGEAVLGMPLVVGEDMLAQYRHKGFGHLYAQIAGRDARVPTWDDMGTYVSLQWGDDE